MTPALTRACAHGFRGEPHAGAVSYGAVPMPGELRIDTPGEGVLRLTISNPAKRNALDHAILDGIAHAVRDADARCIVLTGEHGMFSSGYDIGDIPEDVFAEQAEKLV